MSEPPISLDSYHLRLDDDFVEELISIARHPQAHIQREQARILRELADTNIRMAIEQAEILRELAAQHYRAADEMEKPSR